MQTNSRYIATDILHTLVKSKRPLDHILEERAPELLPQDVAFVKALLMATLRHMHEIDSLIAHFMKNPFRKKDLELQILRIGICQLIYMDFVAEHAAINETVELTKSFGRTKVKGLINAVLRSVQREGKDFLASMKAQPEKNIPQWLRDKIIYDYGQKKAQNIFEHMLDTHPLTIRLRDNGLLPAYINISEVHETAPECRTVQVDLNPTELPDWAKGAAIVQDSVAQIPARLMKALKPGVSGAVLDACAAPGGKTIQLCDYLKDRLVIAADSNPKRLNRVAENLARCHVQATLLTMDAEKFIPQEGALPEESFAAILLDVPCSATGTTRKNPDVLYTRTSEDITKLTEIQKNILNASARHVNIGGLIVYSTCSLLKEESEHQIQTFLKDNEGFERLPIQPEEVGGLKKWLNKNGDLRTTPDMGADGFYAARLIRTK